MLKIGKRAAALAHPILGQERPGKARKGQFGENRACDTKTDRFYHPSKSFSSLRGDTLIIKALGLLELII